MNASATHKQEPTPPLQPFKHAIRAIAAFFTALIPARADTLSGKRARATRRVNAILAEIETLLDLLDEVRANEQRAQAPNPHPHTRHPHTRPHPATPSPKNRQAKRPPTAFEAIAPEPSRTLEL